MPVSRREWLGPRVSTRTARVETPAVKFDVTTQKRIRPYRSERAIFEHLSEISGAHRGVFDLSRRPAQSLANIAGMIVENPRFREVTYGRKESPVFAGDLFRNLETHWLMYNQRLRKQGEGRLAPGAPLVTPKEAEAIRKQLRTLHERLAIKARAGGL